MSFTASRRSALLAVPALALTLLAAPAARASLYTQYSIDGGSYISLLTNVGSLGGSSHTFEDTNSDVHISGQSSAKNASPLSKLLTSTVELMNGDSTAHTIVVQVSGVGYTLPTGPVLILGSSLGGTVDARGAARSGGPNNTAQYETFLNNSTSPYDTSGNSTNLIPNSAQILPTPIPPLTAGFNLPSGMVSLNRTTSTSAFTVTQTLTFVLQAGASINYAGSSNVAAVPEPGTIAMAFTALPLLGLGYWRHRRRS